MGMYYLQPIFKDENLWMISGMPSQQAIMRGGEGSLSNPKGVKVEGGVFMTLSLSHQVGRFKHGDTIVPHVWEGKGVCPFTTRKEWEKLLLISIFCCYFESLRRRENEFGKGKRKRGRKSSKGNENNQTLVHWKEEGKALSLLKKIIAQLVREVKKLGKKIGNSFWRE
jgi:hypothetical protein